MCGMNWYREEMERAEEDLNRLSELLVMLEERYKLSPDADPSILARLSSDIITVYKEIMWRKEMLLTSKSPQGK
ncbi:hypothetical protein SOV_51540 [Sporomusa ovata DSM 2662]|uniref:Uncharacterized protein n=1 Tax=Sporomusa ovata TaxID=2378 RepID=A0A0U1L2H7_9FIRM|nr:hypothetical protein [Sporomusa ovata]EQB27527.1 hypothetical protein SOV_2c04230 [Sporomusa ovata DSM 2662]CQR73373.1 hypothetical protein SpAn4DRAFT_2605 [Sporomusa ovata]